MKQRIITIVLTLCFSMGMYAIDENNVKITATGWSVEYKTKIENAKEEFISLFNKNKYLDKITNANLSIAYNDGKPVFVLEIPFVDDIVETNNQLLGYYYYGSNGFSSTSLETILGMLQQIMIQIGYEGLSVNKTLASSNYVLIIKKDSKDRAVFSGYTSWNQYPKLIIRQEFGIVYNGNIYEYIVPYECLREYGYIYGGSVKDKLSGKENASAKSFESFFRLSLEDREAIKKENERKLYAQEEVEIQNIRDSVYNDIHPKMSIDWKFLNFIEISSPAWQIQRDFTATWKLTVNNDGKFRNNSCRTYTKDLSDEEKGLMWSIVHNMKCKEVASRYFEAHNKKIPVNSTMKFTAKLMHDKVQMNKPLEVFYKYNSKDSTITIINEKSLRKEFAPTYRLHKLSDKENLFIGQLYNAICDSELPFDNKKHKIIVSVKTCEISVNFTDYNDYYHQDCGFVFEFNEVR